ncbi:tetratricopeptide repeat protein [Kitasatospora sp. NPDC051170]|uniref:tetratricopeptide repeat protein n=1 Tax=Kitasatospora sp. NPDC051170 TaxID=3364056 RepID=UPI0037A66A80
MAQHGRGGRPWGSIWAQTPEGEALALFLRARVDGSDLTMTAAAERMHCSTTLTGDFLSGRRVPEAAFVAALLRVTVPEPERRRLLQAEADRLLHAVRHPKEQPRRAGGEDLAGQLERVRAQQVETYERLTHALEQQTELYKAAQNSAQLVMVLLGMINTLAGRVQSLSAERDGLLQRAGDGRELEDTQQRLARALDQERRAKEELARARDKQRQAEELAARVQRRVDELADELDRLRTREPGRVVDEGSSTGSGGSAVTADPVGDDIDQALARAIEVNDTDEQALRRITDELHDAVPAEAESRSPVLPDNRDNPVSSAEPAEAGEPQEEARKLEQLVAIQAGFRGSGHPYTLTSRYNHALEVGKTGEPRRAARLLAELIQDQLRVLGPDHPDTLTTRHTHAVNLGEAGEHREAARLLAELIQDRVRLLGANHPDTLLTRHSHAVKVGEAGMQGKAGWLLAELIQDQARVLGPGHPDTLVSRRRHAFNAEDVGDHSEAARLFAELATDQAWAIGRDHPDTLASRHSRAVNLGEAGEHREAARLLAELVQDRARVLGPDHPDTLLARHSHALHVRDAGERGQAARLLAELAEDQARVLGPEHPATVVVRRSRAHLTP